MISSKDLTWGYSVTRTNVATPVPFQPLFRIIQLMLWLGLILGIVGGTTIQYTPHGSGQGVAPSPTSQASVTLYIVAFLATAAFLGVSYGSIAKLEVPFENRRVVIGVAAAQPFLLVRILYSAISVFSRNPLFSIVGGDFGIYLGMAFIDEIVVVVTFLTLGFLLREVQAGEEEDGDTRWHT